ncbi:hypothetical protein BCR33DRAFT_723372 [Rhizoclosmatium globosum]|uniref:Uncharacterized protein n=1 Tax=Rhizoclosmatium globosum TaxID=329046 RepID=A0A1Y2BD01_9FUNG|nr:hypothetical protein BCR33DRAFT_723372 [Rhizoclosmatium globosum]|eukprot:ORY32709.1 hypothetical protein BCR33DRAFT_723372 [Rhizoclosmatium globosum]
MAIFTRLKRLLKRHLNKPFASLTAIWIANGFVHAMNFAAPYMPVTRSHRDHFNRPRHDRQEIGNMGPVTLSKLRKHRFSKIDKRAMNVGLIGLSQASPRGPTMVAPINYYYGNTWSGYEQNMQQFHTFLNNLSSGSWWQLMAQYKSPPYSRFRGAAIIPKNLTITDELQIRPMIGDLIARNIFPSDPNALYVFISGFDSKPNQITTQGSGYCSVFCGFHSDFVSPATKFANIKYLFGGMTCNYCGNSNPWTALQLTISHEIAEAITDPLVGDVSIVGPPLAWYNEKYGEIGDICNSMMGTSISNVAGLPNQVVQKIWSNTDQKCMPLS